MHKKDLYLSFANIKQYFQHRQLIEQVNALGSVRNTDGNDLSSLCMCFPHKHQEPELFSSIFPTTIFHHAGNGSNLPSPRSFQSILWPSLITDQELINSQRHM